MAQVILVNNPFEPFSDTEAYTVPKPVTVRGWLLDHYGKDFVNFARPTVCLFNGVPLLQKEWRRKKIKGDDVVNFVVVVGEFFTILAVITVLVSIAAVALTFLIPRPSLTSPGAGDPVYNLQGRRNQTKLGGPIEVAYGRCRLYPSYAAEPYTKYEDNQQVQFQLFCLGQGYYDVESVYLDDTLSTSFVDLTYEIYQPGDSVTMFPDNVITSVEVGGIELLGTNEAGYGMSGPYVANGAGTTTTRLEVDVSLPSGLYVAGNKGQLNDRTVTALFQYRKIDDSGAPLGAWTTLSNFTKTLATQTPQRFTLAATVDAGRYEVRGQRTDVKALDTRTANTLRWEAMRAFLPSTKNYGNVTLLAMKARSSNSLNDRSSNKVNVWATRKLRTWDVETQSWTARVATSSIAWAFCDVMQASYGGRLADSFLDLDAIAALDEVWAARGDEFNGVLDRSQTVWEVARTVARCGRATPLLEGSLVTLLRDAPKTLPTAVFCPSNMVGSEFRWELQLSNLGDKNGVSIEYLNPATWLPETVECLLEGDTGDNLDNIVLLGCTNRDQAYHEGMYIRSQQLLGRENVTFRTELEGRIPRYGDLIIVSHDVPRWGTSGIVVSIAEDLSTVVLDTPVAFAGGTHKILFRKKDGSAAGPFTCVAGANSRQVVLTTVVEDSFFFDNTAEPPMFMFGPTDLLGQHLVVVGLKNSADNFVDVSCVGYNGQVYAFDDVAAPVDTAIPTPPRIPALPTVEGLTAVPIVDEPSQLLVSWKPALGAKYYTLERSPDGATWLPVDRTNGNYYVIPVKLEHLFLRVAGVNIGAGPWATWDGNVGVAAGTPGNVSDLAASGAFTGLSAKIVWSAGSGATSFVVRVYNGATLLRTEEVFTENYVYDYADALTDGTVVRALTFAVTSKNSVGESNVAAEITLTNPAPDVRTSLVATVGTSTSASQNIRLSCAECKDADFLVYRFWKSSTNGFTEDSTSLVYEGTNPYVDVTVALSHVGYLTFYWKCAAFDVWGNSYNVTTQQTVAGAAGSGVVDGFTPGGPGGYAEIRITSAPSPDVFGKITNWQANGPYYQITPDYANGKITVTADGTYLVNVSCQYTAGLAGTHILTVHKNNSGTGEATLVGKDSTGNGCVLFSGLLVLADGDYLDLRATHTGTGGYTTFFATQLNFSICRVG